MKQFDGNIYQAHSFMCECGHQHSSLVGEAVIGAGTLGKLPEILQRNHLGQKVVAFKDEVIYEIVGKRADGLWRKEGTEINWHVFRLPMLPDEKALGEVLAATSVDTDVLVALGGGSITDVVRYVASRIGKPFVAVPTAMSHDGFFTDMALLLIGGMKSTLKGDCPAAFLADIDIIRKAPARMNSSGIGEMASKYTALADWYAASLIRGDYYCDRVDRLMREAIDQAFAVSDGVMRGEEESILSLTDALYKSAVDMNWYGTARTGAGAEHHLTHYWVMRHALRGEKPNMHGEEVGVGSIIILDMWAKMLSLDEKTFDADEALDRMPSEEEWKEMVRKGYGEAAGEAFKAQKDKSFDKEERRREIEKILEVLPLLRERLAFLPDYRTMAAKLKKAGAPYLPSQLHVTREELRDSILYAKEVRSKYTSLWIADALGLLPRFADELVRDMEELEI